MQILLFLEFEKDYNGFYDNIYLSTPLQEEHETAFSSVIRTWTMMLGDIGYGGKFHPGDSEAEVRYMTVTYILFILFLLLGLIITNMWVSVPIIIYGI